MNIPKDELVAALRCISTTPNGRELDCGTCRFNVVEKMNAETAQRLGTDEWSSCDCDAICLAAADWMERQEAEK